MRDVRATVLIGDVSGIPDDLAAVTGWFQDVPAGGPTGAELPRKLLETIGDTLAPGGRLYLPTGTLQDENAILAAARRVFGDNIEPVLERTFPGWKAPAAHVDLCQLFGRLGHSGGLKLLEEDTGVGRPFHLKGIDGRAAVRLWSRHVEDSDRAALLALVEYNLYDAINLKALMAHGYNRMIERMRMPGAPVPAWERGDVLYDVSKVLLAL